MNKIKETPFNERPREKALNYGIEKLSNSELLALILRSGSKKQSVIELAQTLLNRAGGISKLNFFEYEDLIKLNGISKVKALEILAIFEIYKRVESSKFIESPSFDDPKKVAKFFSKILENDKQEKFIVVFLDVKNKLLKYKVLFKGGINSSIVDTNIIFKYAFKYYSTRIICIHNHPSGNTTPSIEDINITKKIEKAGKILNIELLDHIIIGKRNYVSLKQINLF